MSNATSLERFVVLANPASTNAKRVGKQVKALERADIVPVHVVETDRDPRRTSEQLARVLRAGDWLGIGSGDGMVNWAITNANQPIAPLAGGNANDIANMLHTKAALRDPRHILEQGSVIPVHPLHFTITPPDGEPYTRLAAGYGSMGASALTAHEVNNHRGGLLRKVSSAYKLYTASQAVRSLVAANEFKIEDASGMQKRYELVYANGSRMAEHFKWRTDLATPGAQEITVREKRFSQIASVIGRGLLGYMQGEELSLGQERDFVIHDDVFMQFDGEDVALAAGTRLQIGISPDPFDAVTTRYAG